MHVPSTILILGGLGFIGQHTTRALLKHGFHVKIFDRTPLSPEELSRLFGGSNVEYISGDFLDREAVRNAAANCSACIHLVTMTLPATSNEDKVYDVRTNLIGSIQVLEAMELAGVKKLVYLSSGGTVYGDPVYAPIDEDHPTNPLSSYGITKLSVEKYCYLFSKLHALKTVALRVSNPYGPGQAPNSIQGAISVFTHRALSKQSIQIWGDGSVVRDYIHISDVARAIVAAICYTGSEHVINVGYGQGASLNEIISCLRNSLSTEIDVVYQSARSLDVTKNILDISRAKRELGWTPSVTLQEGITSLIENIESNAGIPPVCGDRSLVSKNRT